MPRVKVTLHGITRAIGRVEKKLRSISKRVNTRTKRDIDLKLDGLDKVREKLASICMGVPPHGFCIKVRPPHGFAYVVPPKKKK